MVEEYRGADEREALGALRDLTVLFHCSTCNGFFVDDDENNGLNGLAGYVFTPLQQEDYSAASEENILPEDSICKTSHDESAIGYCAYPMDYDWRHRKTFICKEGKVVYSVDNYGKPVKKWPRDSELSERFTTHYGPYLSVSD